MKDAGILPAPSLPLKARMQRVGITHERLARHLGRDRSVVTRMLNDDKHWPDGVRKEAESYVSAVEARLEQNADEGTLLGLSTPDVPKYSE